jgi:hypothetical protein
MIVLVTASRDWGSPEYVWTTLDGFYGALGASMVIMHGHCGKGGDEFADQWALNHQPRVPAIRWPADWKLHGKAAGMLRNRAMVDSGVATCQAFVMPCSSPSCRRVEPHGSHGATGCADYARLQGVPTVVHDWVNDALPMLGFLVGR